MWQAAYLHLGQQHPFVGASFAVLVAVIGEVLRCELAKSSPPRLDAPALLDNFATQGSTAIALKTN